MPSQSRISAWFAALVVLAGSVFLLEYVVFFTSDSGDHGGGGGRPPVQSRTAPVAPRPHIQAQEAGGASVAPQVPASPVLTDAVTRQQGQAARRLAVVVPAHAGDLGKALTSLASWPTNCHESTLLHTELILYYAGGAEDDVEAVLPSLALTGGRCFANTRLVLANLTEEENVYPKGPSVQFFKLYLDRDVRSQLSEYDALAIIEWDVIVAHDTSFEKLYAASFGGVEPFWIKGSTLEGVNFHETVVLPESRHVLGHINGNAIYNNTDPAFVQFVNFTLIRWEYTQSYDVALWATISDFPYSWPLWQRYSRKFVAIDLIANVGFQDMNDHAVRKAVASDTLFIHGSLTGGGGSMFHATGNMPKTSPALRLLGESNRPAERCNAPCGGGHRKGDGAEGDASASNAIAAAAAAAVGMSSVCDRSCYADAEQGARFGGHGCGAGDASEFGAHCRTCYTDLEAARAAEDGLAEEERIALERRSAKRLWEDGKKQQRRVLRADGRGGAGWEERGEDGEGAGGEEEEGGEVGEGGRSSRVLGEGVRVGDAWRHGDDDDAAANEDMVIERRQHVIMCDTLMPPPVAPDCSQKCQRKDDTVCDRSCGSGRFGDYNCNWRDYGTHCRMCFNNREEALVANGVASRRGGAVIMCHTLEPPSKDEDWMPPITGTDTSIGEGEGAEDDAEAAGGEKEKPPPKPLPVPISDDDAPYDPANEPYAKGVARGQICAFMTGFSSFLRETQVTVKSVMHFMPGMRMAIATQAEDVSVFRRTLGGLPGVRVSEAISPITLAPLLADRHCGEGTELIFYMNPGELLSRKFTSKDTHSAAGDLLVMYAEVDRVGEASLRRTLATMSVLGFRSPSFSFGMDIMLPVDTNRQLRDVLLSDPAAVGGAGKARTVKGREREVLAVRELGKYSGVFVPEVLAALAYSRNDPGVWFINPQQWVTHHMFQPASIWDIPLVKPRFGCAFDISMAAKGYDVAAALEAQLGHFVSGASCERGFIHMHQGQLKPKASIEFGYPTGKDMPSIAEANLRVSVVFYAGKQVSPTLLDASVASVAARFPGAAEVVVIFYEAPVERAGLKEVLKTHGQTAPFPVEAIEEDGPPVEVEGGWPGWSGMRVDDFATGEFVMQLEVGDILVEDVTYDNVFHFGKSVIPFQRLSLDTGDDWDSPAAEAESFEDRYIACGMEAVIEMDARWDFALLRGLVYPRTAYSELRMFAGEVHNLEIDDLVQQAHKSCEGITMGNGNPVGPRVGHGIFEASLLGTFMWRFMPDAVHWRALDPLDIQPDEWLSDVGKYNVLCSMGNLKVPRDDIAAKRLGKALKRVNSRAACDGFAFNT